MLRCIHTSLVPPECAEEMQKYGGISKSLSNRNQTSDWWITQVLHRYNPPLYQLSYQERKHRTTNEPHLRIEPMTLPLQISHQTHLSSQHIKYELGQHQ